ncbi:MAG: gamma-glutamyl-gamma-aminobutyrate hydrolase family protein [Abitibacteriaceae bacterium]|nr:gamma-glutamyl-gamma-aminobutyrate hydrolase family protein [Abditibacteriaceae bacterium]
MKKPIILITAGRQNQATPAGEVQSIRTGVDTDYVDAVVKAGGAPIIIPCFMDKAALESIMQTADGVVLTGGGDVVSLTYGEEPHDLSKYQDPVRDEMEFEVTRQALALDLPILAICRGVQLLNVVQGGSLIQDIPSEVPNSVKHYSQGLHTVLLHTIEIEKDSLLGELMGTTEMAINSWHHQAIKKLGSNLRVNCRARDGIIEGVESSEGKPILGVQFHPEEAAAAYPQFQVFFDWVVREAHNKSTAQTS